MAELYTLTSPSGKQYIGVTKHTAEERFRRHCWNALGGYGTCNGIKNALKKYGPDNFVIKTLVVGDFDYILSLEQDVIEVYGTMSPSGYNLKEGGQHGSMNAETRALVSKLAKERHKLDPSIAQKKSARMMGRKASEETKAKMSKAHRTPEAIARKVALYTGRKHSEETKAKMSKSQKARPPLSDETKKRMSEAAKKRGMPKEFLEANKKRGFSRAATEAAAIANKGRKHSEEWKKQQSIKMKEWWAKNRRGGVS